MKIGTDGVFLAWTPIETIHLAFYIGTGTGVIGLMLAQRSTTN
jgi:tRNA1Val (adenine37-N6)-methyltransferase